MGISEALYIPAGLALIADFHPGPTRSRAISLHQMAIYCGVIAGGFSGHLAMNPDWGWRSAFTICGLCGIVYALPLAVLLQDSPTTAKNSGTSSNAKTGASLAQLFTNVSFLLLVVYFTLPALAGWVVRDWMPAILEKRYAIDAGQAGVSATLYGKSPRLLACCLAEPRLIAGCGPTSADGSMSVRFGMALIVPAIFGVGIAPTLLVAIGFLILFGLGWGCSIATTCRSSARSSRRVCGLRDTGS